MTQQDSDLLDSLALTKQELSARRNDRCSDLQLWENTVSSVLIALTQARVRLKELLAKEQESERKLSKAEYTTRSVKEFDAIKDGYERRIRDLLQQATDERVAASNQAAELYQRIELEQKELRLFKEQLDDREERLGQKATELADLRKQVVELTEQLTNQNRAAEECYLRMLELQIDAEQDRERAQSQLAEINAELQSQQIKTSAIEESCRHYRERLAEAEEIKQEAVALRKKEADYLNEFSKSKQDYENKLYLVRKREDFVMQKWDETCRQVAHLRLPIDLQGMPTP